MTEKNMDLENIFSKININSGDKILVSSDIVTLLVKLKKQNKNFDANLIIDLLINKVGPNGTLMFPAFNWDFCTGKDFDYHKTPSRTGALSNVALKREDFQRTKNPIYSFAVTGKDKDYICNLDHGSCFGLNSPFGYLIKNHGKNLFIGIDYKEGFTFDHVAEETVGVDYRYFKNFSGLYIDKFKNKTRVNYRMYVRNLSLNVVTAIDKKLDEVLTKNNAYEKENSNGIRFTLIDLYKAYELMIHDLKSRDGLIYAKKI
jgi:aminoglycoside 3-N-acetyltransferase